MAEEKSDHLIGEATAVGPEIQGGTIVRHAKPSTRLYVGNMHNSTTEGDLIKIFQRYGTVKDVTYLWHRFGPNRGQPKGFGFVEMSTLAEARRAINGLDGTMVKGRKLHVSYSDDMGDTAAGGNFGMGRPRGGADRRRDYPHSGGVMAASVGKRKALFDAPTIDTRAPSAGANFNTAVTAGYSANNSSKKQRNAVDDKLDKLRAALSQLEKKK